VPQPPSRLADTLWFLGDPDAARRARDEAVALGRRAAIPTRGALRTCSAPCSRSISASSAGLAQLAALLRGAKRTTLATRLMSRAVDGVVAAASGDVNAGVGMIRDAVARCGHPGPAPGARQAILRLRVAADDLAGASPEGLAATDGALGASGSRIGEAEVRRVRPPGGGGREPTRPGRIGEAVVRWVRAGFLAALGRGEAEVAAGLDRAGAVARSQSAHGLVARLDQTRPALLSS
jgi:hypothetical protein